MSLQFMEMWLGVDHQWLLMHQPAPASFSPKIWLHVHYDVGISCLISSFCFPLVADFASDRYTDGWTDGETSELVELQTIIIE